MNFLADYTTYTSGTEANKNYHIWTALIVLASLVSRRVWVDLGYFKVYPNLYVVLLGPPGNKKTTAMSIGKKLVARVDQDCISADCQSAQDTVKMMADAEPRLVQAKTGPYTYTPLTIFATELSQYIEIDPARIVDWLVTIFDCDTYTKRTLKHRAQTIEQPCVSLCGCTTPSWITQYLRTDIISGGFSRRCVFVSEDYSDDRRIAFPDITKEMADAYQACLKRAFQVRELHGAFHWPPDVKAHYKHWYDTRTISTDPDIGPFDRTKFIHILKVAMLLSIAKSDDLVMTIEVFELAKALVNSVIASLPGVFQSMGRNQLAAVSSKLTTLLRSQSGCMPESLVMTSLWRDATATELYQIIQHLLNSKQIVRVQEGGKMVLKLTATA